MKSLEQFKAIIWDFDGVILDSMPVREEGFKAIFSDFPQEQVEILLQYHRKNGGLSRYKKIRYFFEEIRKESIDESLLLKFADEFSAIMLDKLKDEELLITDSLSFIKTHYQSKRMHIASGSDGVELNELCLALGISGYFLSILGSPTPKHELVEHILVKENLKLSEVCLIGDSINDFDAAELNGISFFGYNNPDLRKLQGRYIVNFK